MATIVFSTLLSQYIDKFCPLEMKCMLIKDQSFSNAKGEQVISAKLRERYIQTLHDMSSVMFRYFFRYVLFVNKGQDLL